MAIENVINRSGKTDFLRCVIEHCPNTPEPGLSHCRLHGAHHYERAINKAEIRKYQLNRWNKSLDRFHKAENIKSIREEIAIARLTLEGILNKCHTEFDLLVYSTKIAKMLDTIRDLVLDCNKIEDKLGFTLDKSAVINLSEQLVIVLSEVIPEDQMDKVAERIVNTINDLELEPNNRKANEHAQLGAPTS